MLNAMADAASLGVKPLIEGVIDYAQTGDATRASQTAGGVAMSNLTGAATMKVAPKIPLPFRRRGGPQAACEKPVNIDVGGEGRNPGATNVNPSEVTTTTGAPGRPIPNRVAGTGENLPFPDRSVDIYSLENAPIRPGTISEIARVIKPGGDIRLVGPNVPEVMAAHQAVADAVGGTMYQIVVPNKVGGTVFTNIIVPKR